MSKENEHVSGSVDFDVSLDYDRHDVEYVDGGKRIVVSDYRLHEFTTRGQGSD